MLTNKFPKLFLLGMIAILLEGPAQTQAQIIVLSSPSWSQATMGIGTGSYAPAWNTYGLPPEYPVTFPMPLPYSINPDACNGIASAGRSYVSGSISCGQGQSTASAGSTYRMDVYADVAPDSNVRVKFNANFDINWYGFGGEAENMAGFNFYAAVGDNTGAQVNRITVPYLLNGPLSNSGQWAAAVRPPANPAYVSGGKTYYKLGMVETIGSGSLHAATANARYNSAITGITANYIGKVLQKIPAGDAQTGRVTEPLPKGLNVMVVDGDTNAPFPNEPVTFTVLAPVNGASLNTVAGGITDLDGYATTYLTLGAAVGTYTVQATCPGCLPHANTVTFTATAVDKELICVNCRFSGTVGRPLNNPFELKVIDKLTGAPVSTPTTVTYNVISFLDKNNNSQPVPAGAGPSLYDTATDPSGISRYTLTLGQLPGTYIVRARCATCLNGQEQIARGTAKTYDISAAGGGNSGGDPNAGGFDCPGGCCPVTPVLRTKMITPQNDEVSFTSAGNENLIALNASVLPVCLNDSVSVIWQVDDAPDDYMDSGRPTQPVPGPASSFRVNNLPSAPTGRPLPLSYTVTAHITHNGKTHKVAAKTYQDEIDKCRQEYIDIGVDFSGMARSRFTIGTENNFSQDVKDCYAFIYPTRASEALTLISQYARTKISSGYRSPRSNLDLYRGTNPLPPAAKTSRHMFGDAVDIKYLSAPKDWKGLWDSAVEPKILEARGVEWMLIKKSASTPTDVRSGYSEPSLYNQANCLHLGR